MSPLTQTQVREALAELPEWTADGESIRREVTFPTYAAGLTFAVAVGYLADQLDHHPDLMIGYQRVVVTTSSHDAGGVSDRDIHLAQRINALLGG